MDGSSSSEGSGGGEGSGLTLRIRFKSETPESFVERYGADLSSGGIFIRAREPLAVGTTLAFAFSLHDGSALLAGAGTVVWIREASASGALPGMGIRFDRLSGDGQAMLARLLAEKARREREGRGVGSGSSVPSRPGLTPAMGVPETSGPRATAPAVFGAHNAVTPTAPPPSPTPSEPAAARDDSAPVAVEGDATARVELNPLTGEPISRPSHVVSNADPSSGDERGRTETPYIGKPVGPPRQTTRDYRHLKPAGTPPPIPSAAASPPPAGATSPPISSPMGAGSSRPPSTKPFGEGPTRRPTPAFGEPPPRRPTRSSMPVAVRPSGPSEPGRRSPSSPVAPSRGATPVPGGMAVRRSTPVPGDPGVSRRATPVPGAVNRRATPVPGQAGRARSPLPGDRSAPLSPLEGALSSTVGEPTPAQGFGPGRTVQRIKPSDDWEGDATEIAHVPPEFLDDGAVPAQAANRDGSAGSAESRPTNPDLPVGRVAAAVQRRTGQLPTVEAPVTLEGPGEPNLVLGPGGPPPRLPGAFETTGELAAAMETPIMAPPPPFVPQERTKSGSGKLVAGALLVAGLAAGVVFALRGDGEPKPAAPSAVAPAEPPPAPQGTIAVAPPPAPTVTPAPEPAPPPAEKPEPVAAKPSEEPPVAAAPAERKPAPRAPAPKPVKHPALRPQHKPAAEPDTAVAAAPAEPAPAAAEPAAPAPPAAEPAAAASVPLETEYWLYVRSTPPGAEVLIDGEVEGKTPFQRRVFDISRPYAVTIRKDGFESFDRVVSSSDAWVKKGNKGTLVVTTKLARGKKEPAAPAAGEAKPAEAAPEEAKPEATPTP